MGFYKLDLNEQTLVVNKQGAFSDIYITNLNRFNPSAIKKFFTEVIYNSDTNTITELRSFKTSILLNKDSIDFSNDF
ncbi:hypothetical protein ACWGOQ_0002485 [Aquimarina sp. M1]